MFEAEKRFELHKFPGEASGLRSEFETNPSPVFFS